MRLNPIPKPPALRSAMGWPCTKASKIFGKRSAEMPIPYRHKQVETEQLAKCSGLLHTEKAPHNKQNRGENYRSVII